MARGHWHLFLATYVVELDAQGQNGQSGTRSLSSSSRFSLHATGSRSRRGVLSSWKLELSCRRAWLHGALPLLHGTAPLLAPEH